MRKEELERRLLHRDGLMLVIDKPAGIAVHAGPGGGDDLERYFHHLQFGLPRPPSLAHRLDRDTSGCLVLGRHPKALRKLGILFQQGRVEKTYWAAVLGGPAGDSGRVENALVKRTDAKRGWRMIAVPAGTEDALESVTDWRVLGRGDMPGIGPVSFVEFHPRTGRTHQIRVHAMGLGCPVLGDPVYGGKPLTPEGQALELHLHSRAVTVPLQVSKPPVTVTAPVPPHMRAALAACGWAGEG